MAVLFIGTVSADVVELAGQGFIPEPNQEITVQIQTDIPLFCMETIVKVNGDANIISAMSPADCNQYGWDIDWPIDPYIDDVNNEVYFGGVSWMGEANGIVGYFKFRYNSGQVIVSILDGFAADANCEPVSFSDKTLIFGEQEPNDFNEQQESSQDTITNEDNSGEEPPMAMDFTEDFCFLADFNLDRIINFRDFAVFAANWQRFGMDLDGDFDGSYLVDINDLANFAYCWLHILTDADEDGMADEWEAAYGLNPMTNDADDDYDGDGLTNLQEYLARTKPNNVDTDGDGYVDGYSGVVSMSVYPVGTDNDSDGFVDGEATVCSDPLVYDPVEPPFVFEHSYCVKVHSSCSSSSGSMANLFSTASYKLRKIDGNDDYAFYVTLSIYSITNSWNIPPYNGYLSSYSDFLAVEECLTPTERARGAVVLFDSSLYDCPGADDGGVIFLFKNFSIRVGDSPDQSTLVHEIGHTVGCDHQGNEYFYMTPSDLCQNYKARVKVNLIERNKFCPYHQ